MSTQREDSHKDWTSDETLGSINAGSLQRIADATEKMAVRYTELIDKEAIARSNVNRLYGVVADRDKTIASQRGQITKLKNKLAELQPSGASQ